MRLICPNCGAQYEVDSSLIPADGRDVQCSNCGHAWFQRPAHLDPELSEELGLEPELPKEEPVPEAVEEAEAEPEEEPEEEAEAPAGLPPRRALDPEVRQILSDEGEREQKARREDSPLETQGDLGLEPAPAASRRERPAPLPEPEEPMKSVAAPNSRRDLLPDIEEINSSLRPAGEKDRDVGDEAARASRRSGFGLGFMIVVLIAVIAVGVYAFAGLIADQVPALAPLLESYVSTIDGLRSWLDEHVRGWVHEFSASVQSKPSDGG